MMFTHEAFQAELRRLLAARRLTPEIAARRLGVTVCTVESWLAAPRARHACQGSEHETPNKTRLDPVAG